jgi:hypothetical protein
MFWIRYYYLDNVKDAVNATIIIMKLIKMLLPEAGTYLGLYTCILHTYICIYAFPKDLGKK